MYRLFWGKIRSEYLIWVIVGIIVFTIVSLFCGILLLNLAFSNESIEHSARVVIYAMGGFCCALGVLYPTFTILLVRVYPKYPRLTHLLVQKHVFYQ